MIWRRLLHPSTRKLQRWADGEDVGIDRHLATCNYCADRLEPLVGAPSENIRAALLQLLVAPRELPDRLRLGINRRLSDQRDLQLIGEFFALPFEMARVMTTSEEGDVD